MATNSEIVPRMNPGTAVSDPALDRPNAKPPADAHDHQRDGDDSAEDLDAASQRVRSRKAIQALVASVSPNAANGAAHGTRNSIVSAWIGSMFMVCRNVRHA